MAETDFKYDVFISYLTPVKMKYKRN